LISRFIKDHEAFRSLIDALGKSAQSAYAPTFFQGYLLAALREAVWPDSLVLMVAPTAADASRLAADLTAFTAAGEASNALPVRELPARSAVIGGAGRSTETCAGRRHAALALLDSGSPGIVVADATALMERSLSPQGWPQPLELSVDGSTSKARGGYDEIVEILAALGYERLDQVEDPGQFAVRGGIVDVFPCHDRTPARLEFWGEELESIRRFSPFTQRSHTSESSLVVYAAAEADSDSQATNQAFGEGLLASLPPSMRICLIDPELAIDPMASLWEDATEMEGHEATAGTLLDPAELQDALVRAAQLTIESLPREQEYKFAASGFRYASRNPSEAASKLKRMAGEGLRVFVYFASEGAARRAEHSLNGAAEFALPGEALPQKPGAYLLTGPTPEGFVSTDLNLAVFGERALIRSGRTARSQSLVIGGRALMSFRDLTPGDYIVHQDHGIGIFDAVETKTVAGVTRDYLQLRFKGDDKLFVPQEQIDKVSRYVGATASPPPLNKLGGRAWEQARARARRAAQEMAGELLQLYSVRRSLPGHAFAADDQWQMELEQAFPFIETPDQAAAIEDVKDDMESPHPMDRLICGDVGYGKTEVALRAAFKAASQGKQVLMLAPTTILTLQHFRTFSERFAEYPVAVEMISRFRTAAESRRLAAGFREGKIDVLIGTHRVLSSDIIPKDLGLVIVDEEQRFGVNQKESLRQLRLRVDVLTLTATPIPRTLQMSLSGMRDISIMETPPSGRFPIRTFVGEYDDSVVVKAIMREKERGGQVFFLHNRVESIDEKAAELEKLLPGVRFLIGHGQMPEKELETVMLSFLEKEADVLVCTSIIESGLDIPTANTLIVDRADLLGLAQLYQIRGRIGRSDVVAHAYLLYQPWAELTQEARARLSTLSDYSELGSGFKIAMRDLEIRGAGNLLGDEQSGHVAAVGFEMYCDLIRQAVSELQDEPVADLRRVRLDVDTNAYIPAEYVPMEAARIDIHHRIAAARSEEALAQMKAELTDRFGEVPEVVENLMEMQAVRLQAGLLGAAALSFRRGRMELSDITLAAHQRQELESAGHRFAYYPQRRTLALWPPEDGDGLSIVKRSLNAIIGSLLTNEPNIPQSKP